MSESKHTPGPWEIDVDGNSWTIQHSTCRIATIERMPGESKGGHVAGCSDANARLIVVTPELLEVCQSLVDACDAQAHTNGITGEIWVALEAARTVIAKATEEATK